MAHENSITLSEKEVAAIKHKYGIRSGLYLSGIPIGEPGPVTITFSQGPIGEFCLEDLRRVASEALLATKQS